MKLNKTVKKVLSWRILAMAIAYIASVPLLDDLWEGFVLLLYWGIFMTGGHYWFEKYWHRNDWDP
tara:strand:+ start:1200 stop:1394 length:195 start_codon:yes stop_codon:yes gene_type:complete